MYKIKSVFVFFILFILISNLYAQESLFEKGEALFMDNKPAEAIPVLLAAAAENPRNEKINLYLGTAYSQTGNYEKAVESFKAGAGNALSGREIFYYNAGNIYYLMNQYQLAEEMYTRAIRENRSKAASYLNRANAKLNLGLPDEAVSDYRVYLSLDPETYQKESILKLISLLENKITDQKIKEEQDALKAAAEEARKQQLLREVMDSLKDIKQETRSISAGTETISDYEEELELLE